jgi:hypothetical protein
MSRRYKACLMKVRGSSPPISLLDELVDWAKAAPDVIFTPNANFDIYSSVRPQLGPYRGTLHRKAVMREVLRVLAKQMESESGCTSKYSAKQHAKE